MQAAHLLTSRAPALADDTGNTFEVLFEQSPLMLFVVDTLTLEILAVNQAALRHYGYAGSDLLYKHFYDIEARGLMSTAGGALGLQSRGRGQPRTALHRKQDGTLIEVEVVASAYDFWHRTCMLLRVEDLTERRLIREHLARVERIEVMARLTGAVAHDFGNILSIINGFADIIASELVEGDPISGEVRQIREAGESGVALTRQLLAFSRRQPSQPQVLNLNMHVGGARDLLKRFLGDDVELVMSLAGNAGNIEIDPVHLQQVVMNLVVNARDAMPVGGRLSISTENIELDTESAIFHLSLEPGPYVMLAVSDTGCGMDGQTRRRLFEPFFTTKEEGRGTGLGLSIVNDIVNQVGGGIYVYSVKGVGTTFKIYLPRVISSAVGPEIASAPGAFPRGTETVLVVEDEDGVQRVIRRALELAGYRVLAAASGEEAISICRDFDGPIDLLLTDIMMSRIGGGALVSLVRQSLPETKVLLMSGYAGDAILSYAGLAPGEHFLQKPILPARLCSKIREVLDEVSQAGCVEITQGQVIC